MLITKKAEGRKMRKRSGHDGVMSVADVVPYKSRAA